MKITLPSIGKRLKEARERKGMSISDAAEKSGYSERTIRRYEREGVRDVLTIVTMCDAYEANIDAVLLGENRIKPRIHDLLTPECVAAIKTLARQIEKEESDNA